MQLARFNNSQFDRGRSVLVEAVWRILEGLLFNSWLPGSAWRVAFLRLFGAKVGRGLVIKPHVRVKFPWKLEIGNDSWIGESVWLDNLGAIKIGHDSCISQGVYLGTGNHRWDSDAFDLVVQPIEIGNHCWLGAGSLIAPGVICEDGVVLTMGSQAFSRLESWSIYRGVPAAKVSVRDRPGHQAHAAKAK